MEELYTTEKKEQKTTLKLSDQEKHTIQEITLGIQEVDDALLEMATQDVLSTLENGHPLNRLIINQDQQLSGYIACEDFVPNEAYIKYLGTDKSSGRDLLKEIPAFITYAKQEGYRKLNFHGWNKRLNSVLERYGFERLRTDAMGHLHADFYEKTLVAEKPNEEVEAERRRAFEDKYRTKLNQMYEKTLATFDAQDKESIKKIDESFENLDQRLTQTDIEYGSIQQSILKLKLARHFQSNESIDLNVLYDALIETPKFIAKDKGSLNRLLEIHQQKTLEKIAEMRKNRAEITGEEDLNPYEALYETDSRDYYMARLLNMPHLQEESDYMKNCVGTSDSYVNKIKRGDIDILSFRHMPEINPDTNVLEGDTPLLTIEYNRKTKVIEQIKKYDDKYLNQDEPYYNDVLDALLKLRNTVDEKGEARNFKNIASSEMENIDIQENHILTSKGEISIEDYDVNDSEQFILKADTFEITNETSIELVRKACQIPGMTISCGDLEMAQKVFDGRITSIEGDLDLQMLSSAKDLILPERMEGSLYLKGLTTAEGLNLPEHIGGGLYLSSLSSAEGLTLPKNIGGDLSLWGLTSAEGLTLPEHIGGGLNLSNLTSAEGLTLPKNIGGDLSLDGLTSAEGLTLPKNIGGGLSLWGLTSAEGLTLPEHIGGYLYLSNLTSAEGLTLPEHIGGYLYLSNLKSAEGLTLPEHIGGGLSLWGLTSAEGLTLPEHIGGGLNLSNLTSAEGLTLPERIGGDLDLSKLTSADKQMLREKYPQHIEKIKS
jgi:hypothetical protein